VSKSFPSASTPIARTVATFAIALLAVAYVRSQEPVDAAAVTILRKHGLEDSKVMDHLWWICDVHGARLTGSPGLRRAQAWAKERLTGYGLADARLERWGPFGRGWRLDRSVVEVVGDVSWPVHAYPKAWSPSIDGRVEAEVVLATRHDADALRAMDLTDKIVFLEDPRDVVEPFEPAARRLDGEDLSAIADQRVSEGTPRDRTAAAAASDFRAGFQRREAMMRVLGEKRPLAIVDRAAKGDYGTVFVQGAQAVSPRPGVRVNAREPGSVVIPQFTFAVEHYNRICRLIERGITVRVAVELRTTYFEDDLHDYNVVADIPGVDPEIGDEIVMIGAHLDSWHAGTGCTDNGVGSSVVIEAARLLRAVIAETGTSPRRTIRVALWSGEEQGLLGSRAYVTQHFGTPDGERTPTHAKLSGYFNLDNGTGRIRGVYLQQNEACAPIFRAWLRPFHDLGASTLTLNDTGSTDHIPFDNVGLPGFQFLQDPVAYGTRTHHSNMDVFDHGSAEDLKQAATIMAAFAWHAAQRDELLPRKPHVPTAAPARGTRDGAGGERAPR
jgi:carboxypeptidase Q